MRRMISQTEQKWIKALKEVVAQDTSTNTTEFGGNVYIDGTIEGNGVGAEFSNAIFEALIGHFVRIMPAPESTTLTESELDQILKGAFIEGTFLGFVNPILCPAIKYQEDAYAKGLIIGGGAIIGSYLITMATRTIASSGVTSPSVQLQSISTINGKAIPSYPSATGTFTLKCVNGTLTWVQD